MKLGAFVLAILGVLLGATTADADKRVALVLGNGAYAYAPTLDNPRRDAEGVAAALERLGFEVELGIDLDLAGMRRVVLSYARKLEGAEVALFFYAGHGLQVHGQNFLLPVDAEIGSEVDLDFTAVPARLVLTQMERWPAVKIVILDACRDNPFETALSRSMGAVRASRALSRGLAPIEAAGGTLLAYATDPGDVAADGTGDNSPFTDALLKHVETPGLEIHTMLARVRADVFNSTGQRQRPWTESSLIGEFFMAPAPPPPPVTSAMLAPPTALESPPSSGELDPREIELAVWAAAQAGGTAEDFREYLRQYPDGIFANLARNRLVALSAPDAAPEGEAGLVEPREVGPEEAEPPDADAIPEPRSRPSRPTNEASGEAADEKTAAPGAPAPSQEAAPTADAARPAETSEEELRLDGAKRREVQARLLVAGHNPRGVDGIFGSGTRSALASWQAAEGLAATGYLDAAALEVLERRTEKDYSAWVERQRAEESARRAAAARPRPDRQAARPASVPDPESARAAPEAAAVDTPAAAPPAPSPEPSTARVNPLAPPTSGGSARDRYERDCYFVTTGKTDLKRICN